MNFFDTADVWGDGEAQRMLGKALAGLDRGTVVVASKVGQPAGPGPNAGGLSAKRIRHQVDHSLRNLGLDYLDIAVCHGFDRRTPMIETCRAMNGLIDAGKALYWGAADWQSDEIDNVVAICADNNFAPPVLNQVRYNPLARKPESHVFFTNERLGVATVVHAALAGGVLTGKYDNAADFSGGTRAGGDHGEHLLAYWSDEIIAAARGLQPVADRHGVTIAQLVLRWAFRRVPVASVLVGVTSVAQVEEAATAADVDLTFDIIEEVSNAFAELQVDRGK